MPTKRAMHTIVSEFVWLCGDAEIAVNDDDEGDV
jgi:hypothetical protein